MEADLSIESEKPGIIKKSLEVDEGDSEALRTAFQTDDKLKAKINADSLSNLRAGVNTVLRLVKVCKSTLRR